MSKFGEQAAIVVRSAVRRNGDALVYSKELGYFLFAGDLAGLFPISRDALIEFEYQYFAPQTVTAAADRDWFVTKQRSWYQRRHTGLKPGARATLYPNLKSVAYRLANLGVVLADPLALDSVVPDDVHPDLEIWADALEEKRSDVQHPAWVRLSGKQVKVVHYRFRELRARLALKLDTYKQKLTRKEGRELRMLLSCVQPEPLSRLAR